MIKTLLISKKGKAILTLTAIVVCMGIIGTVSKAQTEKRAANIKSKGVFDYDNGTVVMDASDLIYLADEIDLLEETYKKETVNALNEMNTYFMLDNSTTHNPNESNLDQESSSVLPFHSIIDGILASQSIPEEKTYTGTLPGDENEITGNIQAATEDGLSLGEAGWVDGKLIIGNGADNNNFYNQGYADGLAGRVHGTISYVRHHHTDECYKTCIVTYSASLGTSSGEGNECVCGARGTTEKKWSLSHSVCGKTGDTTIWVICNSCGRGIPSDTNVHSTHNVLICGKTEGQIESAQIVYP